MVSGSADSPIVALGHYWGTRSPNQPAVTVHALASDGCWPALSVIDFDIVGIPHATGRAEQLVLAAVFGGRYVALPLSAQSSNQSDQPAGAHITTPSSIQPRATTSAIATRLVVIR